MKGPINKDAAQRAIGSFLEALGYDLTAKEFAFTPARVVEAFTSDLLAGERVDIQQLIERGLVPSDARNLVVIRDIATMTVCPHHLLPAQGRATVAYLPGTKLLGFGTLARLVNALSRRLTVQEQVGQDVTHALMQYAGARGALCALRLEHACLRLRGARQIDAVVESIHVEGLLREEPYAQQLGLLLNGASSEPPDSK
jgi:GTP cyclohydrolase I